MAKVEMDPNMKLSEHFRLKEFLFDGCQEVPDPILKNLKRLCAHLEEVRTLLGDTPIIVTSGYQAPQYNRKVGGAKGSYHLQGKAADIVVPGMSPARVQSIMSDWGGGMGLCHTFTHLDIGPHWRWNGP